MSATKQKHYHFIGIGGIGMGTLASLMMAKGNKISGSDVKESAMTKTLGQQGAQIWIGHDGENIRGAHVVVYSSAIQQDNPEIAAAKELGLPILQRAQLLATLMEQQIGITIAGAHGKTTTTSMVSQLLLKAGLNPTTAIGGIVNGSSVHASLGDGKYFVSEVDESDGSFLYFSPRYSIITNVDFEHVDYYQNWDNILATYGKFIERTEPEGVVIACGDDAKLKNLLTMINRRSMTYGFSESNDVIAANVQPRGAQDYSGQFDCIANGKLLGTIQLSVPGRHNILNALACVCLGLSLSIDFSTIQEALQAYRPVNRRFQTKGCVGDICIVDDYGHHPNEIRATLQTAQAYKKQRLITIFQPHRYTRTKFLFDDFAKSLALSDYLIITDIYAASESPIEGVSAENLVESVKGISSIPVMYLKKEDILYHLLRILKAGDLVLTMGAGDIYRIGEDLIYVLNDKYQGKQGGHKKISRKRMSEKLGVIGVLMGGSSSEREISLKSGSAVCQALREAGCQVVPLDIKSTDETDVMYLINQSKIDVAFLALHGEFGEDGTVQKILEHMGIPYTGSDSKASRLAMNKALTQSLLKTNGIPVPAYRILSSGEPINFEEVIAAGEGFPLIVKPACGGSSIGTSLVQDIYQLKSAIDTAFQYGPQILIEHFIEGREMTVGILDGEALPVIEIRSKNLFFDFTAKYQKGMSDTLIPAPIAPEVTMKVQQLALQVYRTLGCRDMGRVDFMFNVYGQPFVLEINTIPGFTSMSLLPLAAQYAGYKFPDLCLKLAYLAYQRKQASQHQPLSCGKV